MVDDTRKFVGLKAATYSLINGAPRLALEEQGGNLNFEERGSCVSRNYSNVPLQLSVSGVSRSVNSMVIIDGSGRTGRKVRLRLV